ncbi:hypothetical protein K9M78_08125 [Candidatus Bipolaricaulota bacterium]|nr:hypothetical protein [Candidatus Bipolaricaulota bacterium]
MSANEMVDELAKKGLSYQEGSILWYLRGGDVSPEGLEPSSETKTFRHEYPTYTGREEVYVEDLEVRDWVRVDRIMDKLGQPKINSLLKHLENLGLITSELVDPPRYYMEAKEYKLTSLGECLVNTQSENIRNAKRIKKIKLDIEKLKRAPCYHFQDDLRNIH